MAESSGSRRGLMGCAIAMGGALVLCCCGGATGMFFSGDILMWLATSDHAVEVPATPYDEVKQTELRARLYKELDETGSTTITAEDVNVLASGPGDTRTHVAMVGDDLTFDLTTRPDQAADQYINVHLKTAFVMEGGWFTHLTISEAKLSDWDLGQYVVGQELAMNANQSLAKQRSGDPELDAIFAATERVAVADGKLEVKVDQAKIGAVLGRSQAVQAVEAPVPAVE